ncbi:MAG: hypothetical protein KatS3mg044_0356 [Rhodothermaceae bacterium]|nr:MAG: hypothetical protein KatS3mg044_0356 [Rhodothermaceae bacterium]
MMLRRTTLIVGLAILAAAPLTAQESQNPWIFSTYYQCDNTQEAVADRLVGELGEVFDAQVSSGNLMSWGWISHHVGGLWRRALYFVAADADNIISLVLQCTYGIQNVVVPRQASHLALREAAHDPRNVLAQGLKLCAHGPVEDIDLLTHGQP